MQSDPLDFELAAARWGLRGFWFLGGVAASVVIGYGLVPAISDTAWLVAVALFICAVICILVMIARLVQYGFARRAFYHQVSTTLGAPHARELRQSERPSWWNRLTTPGQSRLLDRCPDGCPAGHGGAQNGKGVRTFGNPVHCGYRRPVRRSSLLATI